MRGTVFGGPHDKDYSILGSILVPLILVNYPFSRRSAVHREELRLHMCRKAICNPEA